MQVNSTWDMMWWVNDGSYGLWQETPIIWTQSVKDMKRRIQGMYVRGRVLVGLYLELELDLSLSSVNQEDVEVEMVSYKKHHRNGK